MNYQIVSDSINDSFGVEFYIKGQLILDINRLDSKKTKSIRMYVPELEVDLIVECIEIFRREVPQEFP